MRSDAFGHVRNISKKFAQKITVFALLVKFLRSYAKMDLVTLAYAFTLTVEFEPASNPWVGHRFIAIEFGGSIQRFARFS